MAPTALDPPLSKLGETRPRPHPCPSHVFISQNTVCPPLWFLEPTSSPNCSTLARFYPTLHLTHLPKPDTGHPGILPNGQPTLLCPCSLLHMGIPSHSSPVPPLQPSSKSAIHFLTSCNTARILLLTTLISRLYLLVIKIAPLRLYHLTITSSLCPCCQLFNFKSQPLIHQSC